MTEKVDQDVMHVLMILIITKVIFLVDIRIFSPNQLFYLAKSEVNNLLSNLWDSFFG